jgi:hypothetical protein
MHVDDFIDSARGDSYARFVLHIFRLPAILQYQFSPWLGSYKLFATHCGVRYRVTGASRLGDVWLAEDLDREDGYDIRTDVEQCENWGPVP